METVVFTLKRDNRFPIADYLVLLKLAILRQYRM